jgi:hypothetical protein
VIRSKWSGVDHGETCLQIDEEGKRDSRWDYEETEGCRINIIRRPVFSVQGAIKQYPVLEW